MLYAFLIIIISTIPNELLLSSLDKQHETIINIFDLHIEHHAVNFKNVAESLGAKGIRLENPNDLPAAFDEAFNSNKLFILDVVTDQYAFPPKPWTS